MFFYLPAWILLQITSHLSGLVCSVSMVVCHLPLTCTRSSSMPAVTMPSPANRYDGSTWRQITLDDSLELWSFPFPILSGQILGLRSTSSLHNCQLFALIWAKMLPTKESRPCLSLRQPALFCWPPWTHTYSTWHQVQILCISNDDSLGPIQHVGPHGGKFEYRRRKQDGTVKWYKVLCTLCWKEFSFDWSTSRQIQELMTGWHYRLANISPLSTS